MTATGQKAGDRQLAALAGLLQIERRARDAASPEALAFLMVNDTHLMSAYRQAMFWRADSKRLQAVSGLASPEPDAPFTVWLNRFIRERLLTEPQRRVLSIKDLEGEDRAQWAEHMPRHMLVLPLQRRDGPLLGLLLLARDVPWAEPELPVLDMLVDCYSHAWAALMGGGPRLVPGLRQHRRKLVWAVLALSLAAMFIPVRYSALAPAEISPQDPAVIRAPLNGVVAEIMVSPNQQVGAGDILARFDQRELDARLEAARQLLAVAEAEFRQAQQMALFDERAKANLAVLQGRRDQQQAETDYLADLVSRTVITAPRAGVALFDDSSDWLGKPVSLGERIMMVADADAGALDISLPVGDAIQLEPGAEVRFFLNIDPAAPIPARLERIGYRAQPMGNGVMAYRLKAVFTQDDPRIRVGLKGTARISGERTILAFHLLRRPLAAARLWLGL